MRIMGNIPTDDNYQYPKWRKWAMSQVKIMSNIPTEDNEQYSKWGKIMSNIPCEDNEISQVSEDYEQYTKSR